MRLATERLVLRELRADDWRDAQVLDRDPEVVRYTPNDVLTPEATQAWLARNVAAASAVPRTTFDLAITRPGEDRYLGRAGLHVARPEHREAMVWFTLRRDLWGQGLASEAARAVVSFGFRELKLHRVFGDCDPRNAASARLMERLGFVREAHFRENWWLKGEWCDSYIYAQLARDWRG